MTTSGLARTGHVGEIPERGAERRSFDELWGDGCEEGAGRVGSVGLGEQREEIAGLDGQAFIVAGEQAAGVRRVTHVE